MVPKVFIILGLVACLIYGFAGSIASVDRQEPAQTDDGRTWQIESVDIADEVLPEGSLAVGEAINVKFNGAFRGFSRDIPLFDNQQIRNLSVGDIEQDYRETSGDVTARSPGEPGTWLQGKPFSDALRIVWNHDTDNKARTFVSGYEITNAAERFEDGDVIRIRAWGQYWKSSVNKLKLILTLPKPVEAKLSSGPYWLEPQTEQRGKVISLQAKDIPVQQQLDLLVILPRGTLGPGVTQKSGPLPQIKTSVADKAYTSVSASSTNRFIIWFFGLLIIGFGGASLWLLWWKQRSKDADYNADGLTYDPPAGQSLVTGFTAAEEKTPNRNRAVVATLIDMIARGYYQRENIRDESGNWRLQISLPASRDSSTTVTPGEAAVISYFDQLLLAGPCIVDDLDSRVSPTKEDHDRYSSMTNTLIAETQSAKQMQKSRGWIAKPIAIVWVLIIAWLISFLTIPAGVGGFSVFFSPLVAILVIVAIVLWPKGDFVKSDQAAMVSAGPWRGWRDFILNFSSMETAPDLQVILWERAFAGALLFGVAGEFTERAKILVPNLPEDTTALAGAAFYSSSLGSSLDSSSTPPSSSGGSGFGGGGGFDGGGSGGGGGDAW